MSIIEAITEIPAEHEKNVFGQFDQHIKKIERTLNVTMILRDGTLKIIGDAANVSKAKDIVQDLVKLSMRGNTIEEQNINYALALAMENSDTGSMVEIDKDCICHTINGKVIKPKTLGQKAYVDAIRNKMIVFGIGPAGTGKTYLAMAMAISAFKPAKSLASCRAISRVRWIRIFAHCTMPFIRSWDRTALQKIWKKVLLRSLLWLICEAGHWIMPSSFLMRHRIPHRLR